MNKTELKALEIVIKYQKKQYEETKTYDYEEELGDGLTALLNIQAKGQLRYCADTYMDFYSTDIRWNGWKYKENLLNDYEDNLITLDVIIGRFERMEYIAYSQQTGARKARAIQIHKAMGQLIREIELQEEHRR